jgi:RNA polymerase sigma-70 factor, ECF subfamily
MSDDTFAQLVRDHLVPVRRYAARRVPPDDVEDVVAEVFATAWRHRAKLPDPPRFWLLRTAWFHIQRTSRGRRRELRLAARLSGQRPDRVDGPEESAVEALRVRSAMARLSDTDQEVLRLAAWEGLSAAEIADVLVCSPITARARLHRARRRLARLLGEPSTDVVALTVPTPDPRSTR